MHVSFLGETKSAFVYSIDRSWLLAKCPLESGGLDGVNDSARLCREIGETILRVQECQQTCSNPNFHCVTRWFWIAVLLISSPIHSSPIPSLMAEDFAGMAEATARIRSQFRRLDANGDMQVDLDEFQSLVGDTVAGQRDFRLFDFDSNGRLSRAEFACWPEVAEAHLRGTMPDPLEDLIDDAVTALDESYDQWDWRPDELVSAHAFVSNFLASISPEKKRFVTGRIVNQADSNADGRISRFEAKHFLEQQLGLRLHHGSPLREPTGRLVRYDLYLAMDEDHDGAIDQAEFLEGWWKPLLAQETFNAIDRDRNGRVTYDEYVLPLAPTYFDPIAWFRDSDTDLNARLSRDELELAVESSRRHLAESAVRAFDDDQDGELSLREYRCSMIGSFNYPWDRRPLDQDRDGMLSYDEFVFDDVDLFQLQRWYFFHRLDLDKDGRLSLGEFEFRPLAPLSIRAYSTKQDQSRLVYQNREFPDCGWPSVSPDGTQILLHECPTSTPTKGRIVSITLDRMYARVICDGIQPSWSADGEQFVCARRSRTESEIWILDAGGRRGRRVAAGKSPKWSPDGRFIAFLHDNGLSILDIEAGEIRQILLREDHPYQDLGSDIAWSPDSQRLAALGNFAATSQLLILPVDLAKRGQVRIRYSFDVRCQSNLNWTDRDGVLLGVRDLKSHETRLISVSPDSDEEPNRVDRLGDKVGCRSACLTPDGKWYITVVEE